MGNETSCEGMRISNEEFLKQTNQYLQNQQYNELNNLFQSGVLDLNYQAKQEAMIFLQKLKTCFSDYLQIQASLSQKEQFLQIAIYEDLDFIQTQLEQNINVLQDLKVQEFPQNLSKALKIRNLIQNLINNNNLLQSAIKKLQCTDFNLVSSIEGKLEVIFQNVQFTKKVFLGQSFDTKGSIQKLFSAKDTPFYYQVDISQNMKVQILELKNIENFDQHHRAIQLAENILLVSGGQKQINRLTLVNENQAQNFSQLKGRYSHGVTFDMEENVFLIAGSKSDRTCEIFKYKTNQHEFISNYPFYAFSHSCAMLYDFVYGFGGKDKDLDVFSNGIFYYDTIKNKWFRHQNDLPNGYKTLSVFLPQKASIFIFNNGNPQNQIQQFDGEQMNQIGEDQDKGFCYNIPQFYGESIFFYNENLKLWEYNSGNLKFRKLN